MKITRISTLSGVERTREIPVTQEQIDLWKVGHTLAQKAMPQLTADEREFVMTGITQEEWDEVFKEDDDE